MSRPQLWKGLHYVEHKQDVQLDEHEYRLCSDFRDNQKVINVFRKPLALEFLFVIGSLALVDAFFESDFFYYSRLKNFCTACLCSGKMVCV